MRSKYSLIVALIVALLFTLLSACEKSGPKRLRPHYHRQKAGNSGVIVFVHGVGGDGTSTWTNAGDNAFWPELLAQDPTFDDFDIYIYEYSSPLFTEGLSISEITENMHLYLEKDGAFKHQDVVFIAHSMGGLVTRAYLNRYSESTSKVRLLYFFATPTTGSEIARIARLVSSSTQIGNLLPTDENTYLESQIQDWFAKGNNKIASFCAYEKKKTKGTLVVQMASAIGLCNANILPVDADHFDIVKPAGPDDAPNVAFKSAFNRVFGSPSDYLAMEGQLQGKMRGWINRIFALQSSNGGIRIDSSNPKARTQVWTTAQCLQAVLSSQPNLERYVPQIKAALNYLEKTRRSNPQQGWGVFEEDKDTHTEIAGWVTLANISSLESRTKMWSDAERVQVLARIQRDLTRLVERQDENGGWSEVQVKGEEFTRVYPTVIALWSLLEAKKSESLNELLGNRMDENIRRGIDWLLRTYKEGIGWEPNPARQSQFERFEGLTAQVLFVLSRAEKYFPDLEQNEKYISAERAFTDSMDVHRSIGENKRVPDSDQYIHAPNKTYKLEGSTFLWFPWSFAELTHLSTDSSLKEKEKLALRLRRDVLVSVFQQISPYVGSQPPYVLAEFLLCLSNSIDLPPDES